MEQTRVSFRWFFIVVGVVATLLGIELIWELAHGWKSLDTQHARDIVAVSSRSFNQLVAIMFIAISLAVPVTATAYTPKLLLLFLRDRTNQVVLTAYALAAAHSNWVHFTLRTGEVATYRVYLVLATTILGFAALVPYFFNVIRFLDPAEVVNRTRRSAEKAVWMASQGRNVELDREQVASHIYHMGSLVLKSIDRVDRRSSVDGILAIRSVLVSYAKVKEILPESWFRVSKSDFRGMAKQALRFIAEDRVWIEVMALQQLVRAFDSSLSSMPDAVSAVSDAVRGIGQDASERGDTTVLDYAIRTLNTFLRTSIRQQKPHAIFDLLLQYRALAEELARSRPDYSEIIAEHLCYYGEYARQAGLRFIPELFAYDLGRLLRKAAELESPAVNGVLDRLVAYMRASLKHPSPPLASAGLVTLGSILETTDQAHQLRLMEVLRELPPNMLADGWQTIARATDARFWELTDRMVDLNYLAPELREGLRALLPEMGLVPADSEAA